MTEIEQRAREVLARELPQHDWAELRRRILDGSTGFHSDPASWVAEAAIRAMLTFAREREAEAIEKAAKVADCAVTYVVGEQRDLCNRIATAIRELNTPSEIGGEG